MKNNQSIDTNSNIVSAQIIKINKYRIYLKTETGKIIKIKYPKKLSIYTDPNFKQALRDIYQHRLWIPVDQKNNCLLQYDWLS